MTMLDERPATARPNSQSRKAMIDSQLRVSGVNSPDVLAAMNAVAREDFIPAAMQANAYLDRAITLDDGSAIPAPLVHGRMLVEAAVLPGEKVLVISLSGYLAALASELGAGVTLVKPAEALAKKKSGPFSLILIDGAAEVLPAFVAASLAADGRVVTGTVTRGITRLAAGRKSADGVALMNLAEIGMPVITEFSAPKQWSF
jgi:protein-L-isoaspartate(D-aspartate) O-methyltransferase